MDIIGYHHIRLRLCANKFRNLENMDTYALPKLNQENWNRQTTTIKTEFIIKETKKSPGSNSVIMEYLPNFF